MESEKSHSLPSISWRPKKAGGVILVWIWRPENQGSQWYKSQSKDRTRLVSQLGRPAETKRVDSSFPDPFVLFRTSGDWMMYTDIEEGDLLYRVHWFKMIISPGSILIDTLWKSVSSGHPLDSQVDTKVIITDAFHSVLKVYSLNLGSEIRFYVWSKSLRNMFSINWWKDKNMLEREVGGDRDGEHM